MIDLAILAFWMSAICVAKMAGTDQATIDCERDQIGV
jgi:hypothetical protein